MVNSNGIGILLSTIQILKKMTAYKYMYDNYYSIGTDDDPYSGRRLNKNVK
jgi:hypothetical protein